MQKELLFNMIQKMASQDFKAFNVAEGYNKTVIHWVLGNIYFVRPEGKMLPSACGFRSNNSYLALDHTQSITVYYIV